MVESLVLAGAVLLVLLVALVRLLGGDREDARGPDADGPDTESQRERDRAHRAAQRRPPGEAAEKGATYELVVQETTYDRDPAEIRGTINGLQTFVRDIPTDLEPGDVVRVRVVDHGYEGTTAQATYLERA